MLPSTRMIAAEIEKIGGPYLNNIGIGRFAAETRLRSEHGGGAKRREDRDQKSDVRCAAYVEASVYARATT